MENKKEDLKKADIKKKNYIIPLIIIIPLLILLIGGILVTTFSAENFSGKNSTTVKTDLAKVSKDDKLSSDQKQQIDIKNDLNSSEEIDSYVILEKLSNLLIKMILLMLPFVIFGMIFRMVKHDE
jgi:flagellar basal body-associated protein FliL